MPNHVTNIVKINADENRVREILESVKSDEFGLGSVDFNKIIPMPEGLDNMEESPYARESLRMYKNFRDESALFNQTSEPPPGLLEKYAVSRHIRLESLKLGEQLYNNLQTHGGATWHDWCTKMWGSKWSSYGYKDLPEYDGGDTIKFLTANGSVPNIIQKMSEMFPCTEFSYRWASDDFGMDAGEAVYKDGKCTESITPKGGSLEAYELAADVMNIDPKGPDAEWIPSADGSTYVCMHNDDFELIEICGRSMLFTRESITEADIPQGMYLYQCMAGLIISKEFMESDENNCIISDTQDESIHFTGENVSLMDYRNGSFGEGQSMEMSMN